MCKNLTVVSETSTTRWCGVLEECLIPCFFYCPMRLSPFLISLLSVLLASPAYAQPSARPQMLVVDYAMSYPEENAGLMSLFTEAGFDVQYRQYYPALVEQDASTYDAIVLMGGGIPGMSVYEVDLAATVVWRGKLLILAVPSDTEPGGDRQTNPGVHDRHQFNRLLNRLQISLYAFTPPIDESPLFVPAVTCEPTPGHPVSQGIGGPLRVRAGTRLLAGDGVEPLLTETISIAGQTEASAVPVQGRPARTVHLKKRRVQVQPTETIPDEEVELLLRGEVVLQGVLYLEQDRPLKPLTWRTAEAKGRIVRVQADTLTLSVPGTRWGADHAVLAIPIPSIARVFVTRQVPDDNQPSTGPDDPAQMNGTGRHAVMAISRSDRLKKGYVLVADRDLLNTLSHSTDSFPSAQTAQTDRARTLQFLRNAGRYLLSLTANPDEWQPVNPYPKARIPGVQEPEFPVNQMAVLPRLPARVTVATNQTMPADLDDSALPPLSADRPIRGVWEYINRPNDRTDSLLALIKTLNVNAFWTVSPGWGFTAKDSAITAAQRAQLFRTWGRRIADQLAGSNVRWFAGVNYPDFTNEPSRYDPMVDAAGRRVGLPSLLDLEFWEDRMIAPSRVIARLSQTAPALAGIINDLDTHTGRSPVSYATTDGFNDAMFEQYITYTAQYGFYRGPQFKTFQKLGRNQRFEWLMKTGRLKEYFRFLEDRAERLGRLYRNAIDAINPALLHGGYVRRFRLTWFHAGFWRGVSTPDHPSLLLTYDPVPAWFVQALHRRGVHVRPILIVLMGLVPPDSYPSVLRDATSRGGYCLERGVWLVSDPEREQDVSAPQRQGVTRGHAIDAIREANRP